MIFSRIKSTLAVFIGFAQNCIVFVSIYRAYNNIQQHLMQQPIHFQCNKLASRQCLHKGQKFKFSLHRIQLSLMDMAHC